MMTSSLSNWILALFGLTLLLATLSLLLRRGVSTGEGYSLPARLFLIALRLAIGWHFFIEGLEKLHTPGWSSEPYLREAVGPLAENFHQLAGDRLVDKLKGGNAKELPSTLNIEWQAYFDAFARHYTLTPTQVERARERLDAAKLQTAQWLMTGKEEVTKIAPYPPDLKLPMTMKDRLAELARLQKRVEDTESRLPSNNPDLQKQFKEAKADLNKWRAGLKKSLDGQAAKMKEALKSVLYDDYTFVSAAAAPSLNSGFLPAAVLLVAGRPDFIAVPEQSKQSPLPEPVPLPREHWQLLEWSDAGVTWGLLILGGCLMVGLFSRLASFAGALLVLSFYLAMPPLPGYPEGPRLEGHYVLINKTLIEVLALAALAFIPTGRWAGIDGLLYAMCPWCDRAQDRRVQTTTTQAPQPVG
jgi:uncharacterized membrane protein YphA (DoxX/SURF4 family)